MHKGKIMLHFGKMMDTLIILIMKSAITIGEPDFRTVVVYADGQLSDKITNECFYVLCAPLDSSSIC